MKNRHIFIFTALSVLLFASSASQANGYYPYGYPPAPGYGYAPPPVYQAPPAYRPYAPPMPYARPYYAYPQPPVMNTYRKPETAPAQKPVTAPAAVQLAKPLPQVKQQPEKKPQPVKQPAEKKAAPLIPKPSADKEIDHKQAFINKLLPIIEDQNREILKRRQWLISLYQQFDRENTLSDEDKKLLSRLEKAYRVSKSTLNNTSARKQMLIKVDIIPASLTLAQAANESAWGRSRFAREANNLFGIWTYDEAHGLKPKKREAGKKHFVRKFDNISDSVRYYMQMLNSHPAYAKLRNIRAELRHGDEAINGHSLAAGLEKYSAKGDKYISLIQQLITQNQWASLDDITGSA